MIIIEYCEHGTSVSDFNYSDWIYNVKKTTQNHTFCVSTQLPIDLVRLAIVRGELNHSDVTFLYCGHYFQANEYGAIQDWPEGFCDRITGVSEDILRCAMKKRKQERAASNNVRGTI